MGLNHEIDVRLVLRDLGDGRIRVRDPAGRPYRSFGSDGGASFFSGTVGEGRCGGSGRTGTTGG